MNYKVVKLDKRYANNELFSYYAGYYNTISATNGPEKFNQALEWCTQTFGWSAEIQQYIKMLDHFIAVNKLSVYQKLPTQRSEYCNPLWSWSNHYDDLRIYFHSDKELMHFQLRFPR